VDEGLRAGLLFFALLSALGAVPVLLRRLRPAALLALHLLGMSALLALVLTAQAGGDAGRGVLSPYTVALALALLVGAGPAGRDEVRPLVRWLAIPIAALGVIGATPWLSQRAAGRWLDLVTLASAALYAIYTAAALLRRARGRDVPAQRAADVGGAAGAGLAAAGTLLLCLPGAAAAIGIVALAAGGAVVTAVRAPPFSPPTGREHASAVFIALATGFAIVAARGEIEGLVLAAQVGLSALGVLAVSRPLLLIGSRLLRVRPPDRSSSASDDRAPAIAEGALSHVAPMLDDAFLRRPSSPRITARVTARQLLDSALESVRGSSRSAPVEVREDGADVDVEGDPAELAEALGAVLDNALGLKQAHPKLYVRVHVRGSAGHVTFEVSDDLAEQEQGQLEGPIADRPFASARAQGDRPGFGVGLARARLIAERHGGSLLVRQTKEGSTVQLTLPRRRRRPQFGVA
jgi:signal transduction histidine kinase